MAMTPTHPTAVTTEAGIMTRADRTFLGRVEASHYWAAALAEETAAAMVGKGMEQLKVR